MSNKNRVMSNKSCITMDAVVWLEVKKIISYRCLETNKHWVSVSLSCSDFSWNILINNLVAQFFYSQNRRICLSRKILCQYYRVFLIFFLKNILSGAQFEINIVQRNIVSTGQSVWALKNCFEVC